VKKNEKKNENSSFEIFFESTHKPNLLWASSALIVLPNSNSSEAS